MSFKEIVMVAKQKYDELMKHNHASNKDVQFASTQTESDIDTKKDEKEVISPSPPSNRRSAAMFVQQRAEDGIPGKLFTNYEQQKNKQKRLKTKHKWIKY